MQTTSVHSWDNSRLSVWFSWIADRGPTTDTDLICSVRTAYRPVEARITILKKKKIAINFAGPLSVYTKPGDYPFKSILESHYDVEISDRPDYLFVTQNPKSYRSLLLEYDSAPIRIFNAGEAIVPDFNLCDYGIGFDPIDFGDRYFHIHPFVFFEPTRRPECLCRSTRRGVR